MAVAVEPRAQQSAGDGAPDAEAAVPDLERAEGALALAEVEVVVGGDVVEPGADESGRDGPESDVGHLALLATTGHPALVAHPHRGDDAQDDRQRVGPDRERPEVPHALRGAGDGPRGQQGGQEQGHESAFRILCRSVAMSEGEVLAVQTRSPSRPPDGDHVGGVVDLVAAARQLLALEDVDAHRLGQVHDLVQRTGDAHEPGVEPVEIGPERGRGCRAPGRW